MSTGKKKSYIIVGILVDPRGLNEGRSSKFRVRQTPEKGRRTYRPKHYGNNNNNKDEDNSPKTLNDNNEIESNYKRMFSWVKWKVERNMRLIDN